MITSQHYHEQVTNQGGADASSQPPLPDDSIHKDQQKQIDQGYASSTSTDDYTEEASSESDDADSDDAGSDDAETDRAWDGKINGKYVGAFECLNDYSPPREPQITFFSPFTKESYEGVTIEDLEATPQSESDDAESDAAETDDAGSDDAESDDAESDRAWDGKINGKYVGAFECLNAYSPPREPQITFFSPFTKESYEGVTLEDLEATPQSENVNTLEAFLSRKPTGDNWKKSWPKEAETTESSCVNVYSYFEKVSGYGGYAVILRNMSAQPIAATTNFSSDGKSYLFQVLDGLLAGLCLASKHGCSSPYVRCNSRIVVLLLSQIASGSCNCKSRRNIGKICQKCANIVPYMSDSCFETLVPLTKKILSKKLDFSNFECVIRGMNEPARYLAKEAKKKALLDVKFNQERKRRRLLDCRVDLKPNEFSEKLVSLLLDDAYDSTYYNLDAVRGVVSWS